MIHRIVYFDFETGGLEPAQPEIQLAAIATEAGEEIDAFEAKIQFHEADADPEALRINKYDAEVWRKEAKPERMVVNEFSNFLRKHATLQKTSKRTGNNYKVAWLAGHNIAKFDIPRLSAMFERHKQFLAAETFRPLDTLQLAAWCAASTGLVTDNFTLSTLCGVLEIDSSGAHEALADVRMSFALTTALQQRLAAAEQAAG
ncbi:MAG TPA: 3'-5' exonuclease [Polyangiales bacterium]